MSRQRSLETIEHSEYVTIGELVRLTGVRYSTLKFYTEEGMLPIRTGGREPDQTIPPGGKHRADHLYQAIAGAENDDP